WATGVRTVDGLGLGQTRILCAVEAGQSGLRELADGLGLDHSTVSVAVTSLVTRDLLERYPDPRDRRRQRLRISPSGRSALERAREKEHQVDAVLREALSVEELEHL